MFNKWPLFVSVKLQSLFSIFQIWAVDLFPYILGSINLIFTDLFTSFIFQFLQTISSWCMELEWLTLDNLKPRKKRPQESKEDFQQDIR